jgi:hypothetical protein
MSLRLIPPFAADGESEREREREILGPSSLHGPSLVTRHRSFIVVDGDCIVEEGNTRHSLN